MKKILSFILLGLMCSIGNLWAEDVTFALSDADVASSVYTWAFSETKCKNYTNEYVEVPEASSGTISWKGTTNKNDRYIYLYTMVNSTLTKQDSRKIVMNTSFENAGSIAYTASDIVIVGSTSYLVFGTTDDFKANGIKLTVTSAPDPGCTAATVSFSAANDSIEIPANGSSASTSISFSSDNESAVSYSILKGGASTSDASVVGTTFTATAVGTYTVKAAQEADQTYCAVQKSITITVTKAPYFKNDFVNNQVFYLKTSDYSAYLTDGWMSYVGASTGSATLTINPATDETITGTSASYGKVKNNGSRYMEFNVTGITSIKFYFANTGGSDRKIQYKLNGGDATDLVTVVQKTSDMGSIALNSATNNTIRIFSPDNDVFVCALKVTSAIEGVTLGANGYSTYAADYKYTVSGAEVYKAAYKEQQNAVVLTEVENAVVPAGEGIILKGTEGDLVTITPSNDAASGFAGNELVGVVTPTAAEADWYVLTTNATVTAFNPCEVGIMIPAHKAYIEISGSQAPSIRIIEAEDNATDIKSIEDSEKAVKFIENGKLYIQKDGVVYDATGAKVK